MGSGLVNRAQLIRKQWDQITKNFSNTQSLKFKYIFYFLITYPFRVHYIMNDQVLCRKQKLYLIMMHILI